MVLGLTYIEHLPTCPAQSPPPVRPWINWFRDDSLVETQSAGSVKPNSATTGLGTSLPVRMIRSVVATCVSEDQLLTAILTLAHVTPSPFHKDILRQISHRLNSLGYPPTTSPAAANLLLCNSAGRAVTTALYAGGSGAVRKCHFSCSVSNASKMCFPASGVFATNKRTSWSSGAVIETLKFGVPTTPYTLTFQLSVFHFLLKSSTAPRILCSVTSTTLSNCVSLAGIKQC